MAKAKLTPAADADGKSSLFVTKTELPDLVKTEVARLIDSGEIDLEMSLGKDELKALTQSVALSFEARFKKIEDLMENTRQAMQRLYTAAQEAGVKAELPQPPKPLSKAEQAAFDNAQKAREADEAKAKAAPKAEPKVPTPTPAVPVLPKTEAPKADAAKTPVKA